MNCTPALRPGFNPVTIGLMVLGFIAFWPLGLAMLAYIFWGHRMRAFAEGMKAGMERSGWSAPWAPAWTGGHARGFGFSDTGNIAFDEYRRRELDRLEAERRRLEADRRDFEEFVRNLRRAKDQEEFERFMAERRRRDAGEGPTAV
jgi:hypothetical protein